MNIFGKNVELYCKAVINLLIFGIGLLAFIYLTPKLLVFFMPFVVGGIVAWISNPLVRFFERKLKVRRKMGTAVVIVAVIGLVVTVGYLLGVWITEQAMGFLEEWPNMWKGMQKEFAAIGESLNILVNYLPEDIKNAIMSFQENIGENLGAMVTTVSAPTFEAVGRFAKNLPSIIVAIVMCLLSAYFFLAEREYVSTTLPKYIPKSFMNKWKLITDSFKRAVGGYFKAQLKIEIWVYLLMVIGFLILKVDYGFLIAVGIAFLDFLPIFGTGTVLLPWAVIKFINADYKMFIGILLIWGIGQLVRQVIQPKIMGDTIGVPPIPTLFLLYIGYKLAGVLGMIVALPIGIIVVNLYQAGVFETTKNSLKILFDGINRFRRLDESDSSKEE